MKAIPRCLALLLVLAWLGTGGTARAQTPVYVASTTTAVPEVGAVHFLQVIHLMQGPGTYTISQVRFGATFTDVGTETLLLYFYTGVDTDPATTDALAHATSTSVQSGDATPPAAGSFTFTYDLPNPFPITTDAAGNVGIEFYLTEPDPNDPNASIFSTKAGGRFTASDPTVGSAAGYVWNDSNLHGYFVGADRTRFGMTNANTRLALSGTLVQPAPSLKTYARSGRVATLTVDSYTGVNYQLQRATSLTAGNWTNVGAALAGSNGTVLTFTDNDGTDPAAFYRIVAAAASGARPSIQANTRTVGGRQ